MTDNEARFRSGEFAQTLADGCGSPKDAALPPADERQVERFNLTLKWEWAYANAYGSNAPRVADLEHWLHTYNYHRPHMALAGRPPISAVTTSRGNTARRSRPPLPSVRKGCCSPSRACGTSSAQRRPVAAHAC
jgi:transposase InsO family protein